MQNKQLLAELLQVLEDMSYFTIYPSSHLREAIRDATSDSDRIRNILRDKDVQEYIFPDFKAKGGEILDPKRHYITLRKRGIIPER